MIPACIVSPLILAGGASTFVTSDSSNNLTFSINVPLDPRSPNDFGFYLSAPHGNSWVAVGFGKHMKDAFMLVAYTDKDGKNITLSPRVGTGHVEPSYYKNNTMSLETKDGTGIKDGRYVINAVCHNCKGWNSGTIDFKSTSQPMIYAVGADGLYLNSDAKDAGLRRHDFYGSFTMDLSAASGDPLLFPPTDLSNANATATGDEHNDHEYSSTVHAIAMLGAFVAIFPVGTFYQKVHGRVSWHWCTQAFGVLVVLVGAGLGLGISHYYNRSKHYNSVHQLIGIVVVLLVLLQASLGSLHHRTKQWTTAGLWKISGRLNVPMHWTSDPSHTMNSRSGTFSPASNDGSEWSGITRYQNSEPSVYAPHPSHPRGNLATPPISGSSAGVQGRLSNGMNRAPNAHPGNPSPPNSVARSSYGTTLSDHQRRKTMMMEEALSQHYAILRRYLAQSLRDEKGNAKPNRARDKLLRLSPVQFQELSTDVYDELLRRQSAAGQPTNGPSQVPAFLLPKDNFHPKRNQARQKLATLPPPRFRDLATDVFYELERRFPRFTGADIGRNGSPAPSMRGPPSRVGTPNGMRPGSRGQGPPGPGYGPPRNASLGSQVMAGLGIPGVGAPEDGYGRPTAKTFQSSTIIPNKSTMVEDDDDQTGPEDNEDGRNGYTRQRRDTSTTNRSFGASNERDRRTMADIDAQVGDLQAKIQRLESTIKDRDTEISTLRQAQEGEDQASQEHAKLKADLESKLAEAQTLNRNLQSELEKVRSSQTAVERQLRSEIDQMNKRGDSSENEWRTRHEGLNKAHQDLQGELRQHQIATRDVRQEAAGFLNEMKLLSERSSQAYEREETLVRQIHQLEDQIGEWKSRYARAKAQLRTLRTSSVPLQQMDFLQYAQAGDLVQESGLVEDTHITNFQVAIDELLHDVRLNSAEKVLAQVRQVVVAVRQISQDIGDSTLVNQVEAMSRLKTKVSATANNLITACKNFATSQGLSPVSLVDAAASHLSTAMVELIRTAKVRPSPAGELDGEDDNGMTAESPGGYYGLQHERMSYGNESIYSTPSQPNASNYPVHATNSYPSQHGRKPSSREGQMNGVKGGPPPKLGFGIREHDSELDYA
ncbi:MAG: hypothetical protein Q9220_002596 [cf. Caloplaca sp. 1 TL-2023]